MGVLKRIGKLITADIHGMLDNLEDPSDICKQAIRDMEEEIAGLRDAIRARSERMERISEQRKRLDERLGEIERQLALCLSGDDDALARSVVRRKLEQEKLRRFVEQQLEALSKEGARDAKLLAEYEERLAAVRQKAQCFSEKECAKARGCEEWEEPFHVSEEEIELALRQVRSQAGEHSAAVK